MAGNIYLIGFMGVGKGRTARLLAEKTGLFALDTDDLIESMTRMKIRQIFAVHGEPHFRRLEQQVADWLRRNVKKAIVSTGGGFFLVRKMGRRRDRVVYLHSALESILDRLTKDPQAEKKIKKRPLMQDMTLMGKMYEERLPRYRAAADLEIDVEGLRSEEVADRIIERLAIDSAPGKR